MTARRLFPIILTIAGGLLMLCLSGCAAKYRLDYDGRKNAYFGAKDEYRAGETVDLYYMFVSIDTDYSFYLDGERLEPEYVEGKGYHFEFPMPAHDATLRCEQTSFAADNPYPTGEMLVDFYYAPNGSDSYEELVLYGYSSTDVTLCVYHGSVTAQETRVDYLIPVELADECFALLRDSALEDWERPETSDALDGAEIVCKYRKDDGSYVRVSTEQMPADGEQLLARILEFLQSCILPEYRI